jgi:hypothetical protein
MGRAVWPTACSVELEGLVRAAGSSGPGASGKYILKLRWLRPYGEAGDTLAYQ